jgi:hypothetical protein
VYSLVHTAKNQLSTEEQERGGGGKTPSIPARAGALHRPVAEKEREVHMEGPGYVLGTVLLYSLSSSRQRGEGGGGGRWALYVAPNIDNPV